jgi:anti-anti-sigma factor
MSQPPVDTDHVHVVAQSEVDETSVTDFATDLHEAVIQYLATRPRRAPLPPFVVDLSWVTFLDGKGVEVLVAADAAVRERGGSVQLRNAVPAIQRILEANGLGSPQSPPDTPDLSLLRVMPTDGDGS